MLKSAVFYPGLGFGISNSINQGYAKAQQVVKSESGEEVKLCLVYFLLDSRPFLGASRWLVFLDKWLLSMCGNVAESDYLGVSWLTVNTSRNMERYFVDFRTILDLSGGVLVILCGRKGYVVFLHWFLNTF